MDYAQTILDLINCLTDVSFAIETLDQSEEHINEIDSVTNNFTKQHKSFEQAMSDNQHNYEREMNNMETNFINIADDNSKEILNKVKESLSNYKV